jgi:integrase
VIESIDTSTLVGLRDRALIGVMTYAFARIGAVVSMRVEDYFANGKRWWVRLHEKGGSGDHTTSDEFIKRLEARRRTKRPLKQAAATFMQNS